MFSQFYGLGDARGLAPGRRADRGGRPRRAAPAARQHAVDRPAPEDELRPRPAQRPVDPLPRRADARPGRRRGPLDPRARGRLEGRGPGPDGPAHDPLHGRGRRAVRADRDRRPRPDPRDRHARRAQAARPARVDLPARARPPRRRRRRARAAARAWSVGRPASDASADAEAPGASSSTSSSTDDAALGGVVARARRARGAHRRPAQVRADARGRLRRARRPRASATSRTPAGRDDAVRDRARRGGARPSELAAMPTPAVRRRRRPARHRPADRVATGRAARSFSEQPALARRPRLPARAGHDPRAVVARSSRSLLPFLTTSAFVFVYRALGAPEAYIGFVVLGGAMTAFWLNVVWMMAAQLYWEKSQGNLELYFAAPMNLMAILFGMAVGGLVMSSTRAVAVLVIATIVFGVDVQRRAVAAADRRVLPDAVRALRPRDDAREPVPAVGPRGVPHDPAASSSRCTSCRGSTSRSAGWARSARSPSPLIPFAVGLDAMRQLVFAGQPYITGTPSPEVEALILVVMTVVFTVLARWMIRAHRADGPRPTAACRSAGNERRPLPTSHAGHARSIAARTEGAGARRPGPQPADGACSSAGRWRPTGPTRSCSSSTRSPSRSRRRCILVLMIQIIGGAGASDATVRTFVVVGQRAVVDASSAGIAGPRLVGPRRPRALPDAQVPVRQPEHVPRACCVGRGGGPARGRARWARSITLVVRRDRPRACRSTSGRSTGRCSGSSLVLGLVPILALGVLLAAICLQTRQEIVVVPGGRSPVRCSWSSGASSRSPSCPTPSRCSACINPVDVVDRRRPPGASCPTGRRSIGGAGLAVDSCHRHRRAGRDDRSSIALLRDRGARYTRGDRHLPVERAPGEGSRPARPDDRLVAARRRPGAAAPQRGSRRCGSTRAARARTSRRSSARSAPSSTSAGCATSCSLEAPDGFIVQGLVDRGRVGRRVVGVDRHQVTKETLTFLDDDIAQFMEEAVARRGGGAADGPGRRALRARVPRHRSLHGRAEAARRVLLRAGRRVRRPAPPRGPVGLAPRPSPSSPVTTSRAWFRRARRCAACRARQPRQPLRRLPRPAADEPAASPDTTPADPPWGASES